MWLSNGFDVSNHYQFSGNEITSLQLLSSFDKPVLYKNLIVGVESVGLLTVDDDCLCKTRLQNDMSDPVDAYVNRMYKRYNIERRILSKYLSKRAKLSNAVFNQ